MNHGVVTQWAVILDVKFMKPTDNYITLVML